MPLPFVPIIIAFAVGATTVVCKWDDIVYALKGKKIAVLGARAVGKTTLLKVFTKDYKFHKIIAVTSTTGVSALLINGTTLHSYLGIGLGTQDVDGLYLKIKKNPFILKRWRNLEILIIDEISMLSPELFDKLEKLARVLRENPKPFGGIQLIITGDFLQLPPVKSSEFCFESISWDISIDKTFYFDKIIRQNDPILQNILNDIRVGNVTEEVKNVLNSVLNKKLTNDHGIIPTLLFSKKNMVLDYNKKELQKLINDGNENYEYQSYYDFSKNIKDVHKEFYTELVNNQFNVEDTLIFSKNSQVMLTVNIPEEGLANGSRGIIIDFNKNKSGQYYPIVRFLNGKVMEIKPHSYTIDENKDIITKIQIPLILSWAITIHKAQGMTLDFLETDIGNSIFEYGQAYVVLSRIKNLDGLSLINVDYNKIKAHPKIISYYKDLEN
jgi:ATP-dependent DNA helicase PIF1